MIKKVFVFVTVLFLVGVNAIAFVSSINLLETNNYPNTNNFYNTYIVDDEGDGNFTTIQEAIDNASNGDIILVYSGNYSGGIQINKTLNILGIDEEYLNGSDTGNPNIWGGEAYIFHTSEVLFSNFSLGGVTDTDKIKIEYTDNCTISNCSADYLLLDNSNGNSIKNCIFNTKVNFFASINLILSSNNLIADNVCIAEAEVSIYNSGICLQQSNNNQLLNNTCIAKNSINARGTDIAMYIVSSKSNTITGNVCWQSDVGLQLDNCFENYISKNNITMNKNKGIFLLRSENNEITQNNFIDNKLHAFFYKCKGTTWSENYWDDLIYPSPKLIFGTVGPIFGLIPWINLDLKPLQEPYNITS